MPSVSLIPKAAEPGEVVSLAARLTHLQLLRLAFVAIVVAGSSLAFEVSAAVQQQIWAVSGGYLVAVAATELLRRRSGGSNLGLLASMVLVDGLYLAWVTYATGGTQSPLRFLLYVHLVAVTLLASYRTGLKIALWHSLLSFVVLYAQAAELIPARESAPGLVPTPETGLASLPVFNVVAFWIVAFVTAAFSSLNERELRRRRADSHALATMATEMEELHRPEDIADKLLEWLHDSLDFERGVVLSIRGGVSVLASRGAEELRDVADELDILIRDVEKLRHPVLVKNVHAGGNPTLASLLPDARRVLVLPLISDGEVLGVVAITHAGRGWRIERRIVGVAGQLVGYAALALRNAWLLDQIQRMAHTDGLTGVANRRMFDAALGRDLARSARNHTSLSLLLLDVDHFKAFNDRHGHVAGDDALRAVAEVLSIHSRAFDLVARYGGEEFAVVLPDCEVGEAVVIAERLRLAVADADVAEPVTVSVGVAAFPEHAVDAERLLQAADEALYASKRDGRDRVSTPQPTETPSLLA